MGKGEIERVRESEREKSRVIGPESERASACSRCILSGRLWSERAEQSRGRTSST